MNVYILKGRIVQTLYVDGTILSNDTKRFIIEAENKFEAEKKVNIFCEQMNVDYELIYSFYLETIELHEK